VVVPNKVRLAAGGSEVLKGDKDVHAKASVPHLAPCSVRLVRLLEVLYNTDHLQYCVHYHCVPTLLYTVNHI
jgi:hypothetical protein